MLQLKKMMNGNLTWSKRYLMLKLVKPTGVYKVHVSGNPGNWIIMTHWRQEENNLFENRFYILTVAK